MARRRSGWDGDSRDSMLDGTFATGLAATQAALGRPISVGDQSFASYIGLPLPALCLRYFFLSTTFALGKITQITGEEGSAKSAFAYELMRWHAVYGGGGGLIENENKDALGLRCAIWQWNQRWLHRCQVVETYSVEQWQDAVTRFVSVWRDLLDAPGGPGPTVPMCFVVDSIMGTATQREIDEVNKCGHAEPGYAHAAKLITCYMRTMPERLQHYPFSIIGTNHQKPMMTPQGFPTANIPGGKSVKFHETFEIEMSKTMNKDIDKLEYGGLRVKLVCKKNADAPSRRSIIAELLWWYEDDGNGGFRQQAVWDWDTASIELLLSFKTVPGKATISTRLQEICDIHVPSKANKMAYSHTLGIPSDDPQPYRVLGAALERRPELLQQIYRTLGIMVRQPFQAGVDYRALCAAAEQEAVIAEHDHHRGAAVAIAEAQREADNEDVPVGELPVAGGDDVE